MNHVPDEVLDEIDAFGEGLLTGTTVRVEGQLREDLRVRVRPDGSGGVLCRYEREHTQAPPEIRSYGSFVTTLVDSIDDRLRSWGVSPPEAYTYTGTVDGVHRYDGSLGVP
jgi:hypothetical protein